MKPIADKINTLASADSGQLRALYVELFGHPPPSHARRGFLHGNIAWGLQARAIGHNPVRMQEQLLASLKPPKHRQRKIHRAGTRLIREWHGDTYEVIVTENGYVWDGRCFSNLSSIAAAITGVGWSGPRFFGLKK